jgi:hypothetical protein
MDTINTLDEHIQVISLLCLDPMTKILCEYIENKYKNHSIIKSISCNSKTLLSIYVDNKRGRGLYPYFEIWNDTSKQTDGNAISCQITSITKSCDCVIYNIVTNIFKDETYETEHVLKFDTGKKANEFTETDENNEFYNFIEKIDTVSLVLRD